MKTKSGGNPDVDELLSKWPAPARDDLAWDEAASAITEAAFAAHEPGRDVPDAVALLEPVDLEAEPGEPAMDEPRRAPVSMRSGDRKMADDQSRDGSDGPVSSKRMSLKELAERVSKAPPSRTSQAPTSRSSAPLSTPVPSAPPPLPSGSGVPSGRASVTPLPSSRTPIPSTSTPLPSRPALSSRPGGKSEDDSGVVDLNVVRASVTPEQKASAEVAQPGTSGLFDEDEAANAAPASGGRASVPSAVPSAPGSAPASAAAPASVAAKPAKAAPAAAKKSNTNTYVGIAIGIAGLAAAFAMVMREKPAPVDGPNKVVSETKLEAPSEGADEDEAKPRPRDESGGLALDDIGDEEATETAGKAAPGVGGPLAKGPDEAPEADPKEPAEGEETAATDKPIPGTAKSDGDLASEIEKAAGDIDSADGEAEPASDNPKGKNLPAKPSQGSVQAAIGSVMGGAKACVAAADDVTRATLTFSSSGKVQSVAVSGWAAGKGAAGCVKSALQGANVGPFTESSYTVGMTIRP